MSSKQSDCSHDEKLLIDFTTKLKHQYEELSRTISQIESDPSISIESIGERMKEIKQTEAQLRPLRESFQQQDQRAGGELKTITDQTINVVKDLMPKLAGLEKASVESLRRLFPRIQGSVRAVQMQNAYKGNHHA